MTKPIHSATKSPPRQARPTATWRDAGRRKIRIIRIRNHRRRQASFLNRKTRLFKRAKNYSYLKEVLVSGSGRLRREVARTRARRLVTRVGKSYSQWETSVTSSTVTAWPVARHGGVKSTIHTPNGSGVQSEWYDVQPDAARRGMRCEIVALGFYGDVGQWRKAANGQHVQDPRSSPGMLPQPFARLSLCRDRQCAHPCNKNCLKRATADSVAPAVGVLGELLQ